MVAQSMFSALRALFVVTIVLTASTFAAQPSFAQSLSSLSGYWLRNPDDSDDAEQKIKEAARAYFDKATKGGRNILSEEIPEIQKRLAYVIATFVQFAEELDIEEESGELRIDDGIGRIRIFYIDGKKHKRQTPGGANLETICTRRGNRIIVEQKLDKDGRIAEVYDISADGNRMTLTVHFESKRFKEPLVVRNIYDRQE
jgi:hypothetical protein